MKTIGLIVNPVAGMGGRVGLKGTDGVVDEAIKRGARPVAPERAVLALRALREARDIYHARVDVHWITSGGAMGEQELAEAGWTLGEYEVAYQPPERSSREDTRRACVVMRELKVDLLLFCGGDGTARDIFEAIGTGLPVLGIPSGVKMHSGVFGVNPVIVSEIVQEWLGGHLEESMVEIMDLDEELYRRGEWKVGLFGHVRTPYEPNYIQAGKLMVESESEEEVKEGIAEYLIEKLGAQGEALWVLGPGTTLEAMAKRMGIQKTLLGVDAVFDGRLAGRDLDERGLLELVKKHPKTLLLLSPVGAQGFVLGRGNLQLSPEVLRAVGVDNIIIASTPAKLARTPVLRVDTGDAELDRQLDNKSFFVVTGFRQVALRTLRAELPAKAPAE